ncbi:MAG: CoB--CoM heterodisulfide reductase iron-sulfur subunit B family protein [Deltaproteobacteria bacterium]|nr:CoB--CoM heterodisulfide reductase iron-sulfur subunit B family protein [Deltaproteobacteria bacterium]
MKFALFLGCQIPIRLKQYETSSRLVSERLGLELIDIEEFNCCGYPLRNIDFKTFLLASARNLALAETKKLNVMTLCQCCYGALKKADFLLKENLSLRKEVNAVLQQEGIPYEGKIEVKHLLSVLDQEVGVEAIRKRIEKPFQGLKIAAHYGCHALRPSQIVRFDDPGNPTIFERLVNVTGAESIDWLMRLECCGAPLLGSHDELSTEMTLKKLNNGRESGADYLCTACTYCQIQFDTVQQMILSQQGSNPPLPSLLYPQLLGLSMGIPPESLGLKMNKIPIREIGS